MRTQIRVIPVHNHHIAWCNDTWYLCTRYMRKYVERAKDVCTKYAWKLRNFNIKDSRCCRVLLIGAAEGIARSKCIESSSGDRWQYHKYAHNPPAFILLSSAIPFGGGRNRSRTSGASSSRMHALPEQGIELHLLPARGRGCACTRASQPINTAVNTAVDGSQAYTQVYHRCAIRTACKGNVTSATDITRSISSCTGG